MWLIRGIIIGGLLHLVHHIERGFSSTAPLKIGSSELGHPLQDDSMQSSSGLALALVLCRYEGSISVQYRKRFVEPLSTAQHKDRLW